MLEALKKDVPLLSAERLYHFFREIHCEPERLLTLRDLFRSDDHEKWYRHTAASDQEEQEKIPDPDKETPEDTETPEKDASGEEDPGAQENGEKRPAEDGKKTGAGQETAEPETNALSPSEEAAESWRDISGRVRTDLETLSGDYAQKAGTLLHVLQEVTRERYDYGEFLRQFCVSCEVLKTSEEEFDYIYYTYGLSLYDHMPLIEPLEYSDRKRIRDFVIVIDTSASVDGNLVQAFIRKTWNLLKTQETFYSIFHVHILQCDAAVQEDITLTSPEEMDRFPDRLSLKGFGGTDFRPAFEYIDRLVEEGRLPDLSGVIYFTDGDGIYPEAQPEYKTAFVFLEEQFEDRNVPCWAIKQILEKEALAQETT